MTSKTLADSFSGVHLPCGGKAFNLSMKNDPKEITMAEEAKMMDEFLDPAEPDEKPMSLPMFDEDIDECEVDSLENNETKATFSWDGVQDVQNLTIQNHELKDKVSDLQEELDDIHVLLEALEPIPGIDTNALMEVMHGTEVVDQDIRDVKIVEQAKKIKNLNVALNRERGRVATLTEKLQKAQNELEAVSSPAAREAATKKGESKAVAPSESAGANRKVEALRVKLDKANAELRRVKTALSKEIGDGVSITKVLTQKSGWKGRSEKILTLQAKLKRLEQSKESKTTTPVPTPSSSMNQGAKMINAHKEARHQKLELLEKSNADMKESVTVLKRKNDAAKSRIQVLGKEAEKSKGQVKVLLTKANDDDALIELLQKELKNTRQEVVELKRSQSNDVSNTTSRDATLDTTVKRQLQQLQHQQELIATLKRENGSRKPNQTNGDSREEVEKMKKEQHEMRTQFQNLVMEKEDEIATLEDAKEELEQRYETLLKDRNAEPSTSTTIETLREENAFLFFELNKLKQRYGDLLDQIKR